MTKQERIRDGLAKMLWDIDRPSHVPIWEDLKKSTHMQSVMEVENTLTDAMYLIEYLHSQGVVIKVDRELPECSIVVEEELSPGSKAFRRHSIAQYKLTQEIMTHAGWEAVESLIEGEEQGGQDGVGSTTS